MLKALIDELKTYGFECQAGPLEQAVPFQQLEEAAIEADKLVAEKGAMKELPK